MNKPENKIANIYKIVNTINDMVYIGSTTRTLSQRMGQHRGRARNVDKFNCKFHRHMSTVGIEFFKILLIKKIETSCKDEIEKEEFDEMAKIPVEKLLNENIVYKKRSLDHIKKVADSQRGPKSVRWKFGSVFKRIGKSSDGFDIDSWCFSYALNGKQKRIQFSINKFGDDEAHEMAKDKRLEIFPDATD